jgi:tetratricopeptide (TPR) repeat protein
MELKCRNPVKAAGLRLSRRIFILYLLYFTAGITNAIESWEQAAILERSGDKEGARSLYIEWLDKNPRSPGSGDVLLHTASMFENVRDAIVLLRNHAGQVDKAHQAWAALAGLESAIGLPDIAAEHYRAASKAGGVSADRWLLDSLVLSFQVGEYDMVYRDAGQLSASAESGIIRDEAAALSAMALAEIESPEAAVIFLDIYIKKTKAELSPLAWYALIDISREANDQMQTRRAETALESGFPGSAVQYLSKSRILGWASPGSFVDSSVPQGLTWVQVGAFASRESAASLRYRLENAGFTAWLEQNGDLWRVLVHDADGGVRNRLSAKGFSGLF